MPLPVPGSAMSPPSSPGTYASSAHTTTDDFVLSSPASAASSANDDFAPTDLGDHAPFFDTSDSDDVREPLHRGRLSELSAADAGAPCPPLHQQHAEPLLAHSFSPRDTMPQIRSPLSTCTNADGTSSMHRPYSVPRHAPQPCKKRSVRFCSSPPAEVETHNPDDYDRTASPLNTSLSADDVAEMRALRLGITLLESKFALMHAHGDDERHTEDHFGRSVAPPPEEPRGRPTTKLGSALASRFGLNSPPPPLPGMAHPCGAHAPTTMSTRSASPARGYSPGRSLSPLRPCESPTADLCDSGSEYDFVG